ncbi:MAG TPA: acylphosphatase [Candidatus Binatia bacterium]|nr:acylphosphatase [Candidatus Binatia bacterium]
MSRPERLLAVRVRRSKISQEGAMENANDRLRAHVKIAGRVQGVYFRASTLQKARQLGLTGWVMNCPDGSVEAVAEGTRSKLDELITWCHHGPPGARVTKVHTVWESAQNNFDSFRIKSSGWGNL